MAELPPSPPSPPLPPSWPGAGSHPTPRLGAPTRPRTTPRTAAPAGAAPAQQPAWLAAHGATAAPASPTGPISRPLPAPVFTPVGAAGAADSAPTADAASPDQRSGLQPAGAHTHAGRAAQRLRSGRALVRRLVGEVDPADPLWRRVIAFAAQWWPRIWLLVGGTVAYGLLVYLLATYGNTDFYPLLALLRRVLAIGEVVAVVALGIFAALVFRLRVEASERHNQADALSRRAEHTTVDQRAPLLDAALAEWRQALAICPRALAPREWGATQFALGQGARARALVATDGEDDAREAYLLEALVAFRSAAESYAQRSAPGEWAQAQRAIGEVLLQLARQTTATERAHLYGEAASALRATLSTQAAAATPRVWADTQIELARIWLAAAEDAGSPERTRLLGEAAAGYRLALPLYAAHATQSEWATAQHALGTVLIQQAAEEEEGAAQASLLDAALDAYREALAVSTRWVNADEWATLQSEAGAALRLRARGSAVAEERLRLLDAAVGALDGALEVRTQEEYPAQWAATQAALGGALLDAAQLYTGPERARVLEEAAATLDAAARALGANGALEAADATRAELAQAEALLAQGEG